MKLHINYFFKVLKTINILDKMKNLTTIFFLFVITSLSAQQYCTVEVAWGYSYLQQVQFGDINHISESEAYTFNPEVTAEMVQGETYPFHITINRNGSGDTDYNIFKIWVDWNENFVFDADEVIYNTSIFMGNSNENGLLFEIGDITVPADIAPGDYRIRIFNAFDDANGQTAAIDGCGYIDSGEVEDFLITVLEADPSAEPQSRFFADKYSGNPGIEVQFYNNCMYNPTSFVWTFEGGEPSTSTESNPVVTYPNEGDFSVQLVATNSNGDNQLIKDDYIHTSTEYCDVTCSFTMYSYINNIITYEFENESDCGINEIQTDYTDIILNTYSGANQKLIVSVNKGLSSDDPNVLTVWVDWNMNGSFADDGEQVFEKFFNLGECDEDGNVLLYADFEVPEFVTEFSTRMRIINSFDDNSAASTSGCGNLDSGEAEDYTLNIKIDDGTISPIAYFVVDKTVVDAWESISVTDLSLLEDEIEWLAEDAVISSVTNPESSLYFNEIGEKEITLSVSNLAGDDSFTIPITVNGNVGVAADLNNNETTISPNPSKGEFQISSVSKVEKIEIYNQIGRFEKNIEVNSKSFNVNISDFDSGIYFLKLFFGDSVVTKKLVIN